MAFDNSISTFGKFLQQLKDLNLEKVVRNDLGTGAFIEVQNVVDNMIKKSDRILPIISEIDEQSLVSLYSLFAEMISDLKTISKYDTSTFFAEKPNFTNSILQFNDRYVVIWSRIIGLIHEFEQQNNNFQTENSKIELEQVFNDIKEKTEQDAVEIQQLRNRLVHEVEDFEKRYTSTFQKAEIKEQVTVFNDQAENFLLNSKWWGVGVLVCSIFLIITILIIFKNFCFESTCFENIKKTNYDNLCEDCNKTILYLEIFKAIAFRLFIISFIIYLLNFTIKNYNASMHNYTINRHKANSLDASIRLLERLYSEKAKDEVLTNAANAIFSHQPTGYNNKNPENIKSSITEKVIEKINPMKDI